QHIEHLTKLPFANKFGAGSYVRHHFRPGLRNQRILVFRCAGYQVRTLAGPVAIIIEVASFVGVFMGNGTGILLDSGSFSRKSGTYQPAAPNIFGNRSLIEKTEALDSITSNHLNLW
ncbi:MAG: hypothetical protein ND866_16825, partial [Pyrinomonadaceae bacterium]|nr:hypothetical protein [Pyrinomonadaceae bacterium]